MVGASNIACQPIDSSFESVGSRCSQGSQCAYGICEAGLCIEPFKECPSQCSGNGECTSVDVSGNLLPMGCKVSATSCSVKCVCKSGYGGLDCSLSTEALEEKSSVRASMCDALLSIANYTTSSPQLLDTLVSSLMSAYDPNEVLTPAAKSSCSAALSLCTQLAQQGLLVGASSSTISILSQTISRYVTGNSISVLERRRMQSAENTDLDESVSSFTQGVLSTLVEGQSSSVVSDNLQISLHKSAVEKLSELEPSQTSAQLTYGAVPPKLSIGNTAAARALDAGGGYCSMSIAQYGSNPHPNSNHTTTAILRLSTDTFLPNKSSERPLYFITLQFTQEQKLSDFHTITNRSTNFTFPECHTYNSLRATYVPCTHCNISGYTNFNVTYVCSSILVSEQNQLQSYNDLITRRGLSSSTTKFSDYTAILQSTIVKVLSLNPATIDIEKSMVALAIVGSVAGLIIVVALFLARWDQFDHHRAIYIKKKEADNEQVEVRDSNYIEEFKNAEQQPSRTKRSRNVINVLKKKFQKKDKFIQPFQFNRKGLVESKSDDSNIAGYIGAAIDHELLNKDKPFLITFLTALWKDHEYLNVFSTKSLAVSRFTRWMLLCCRFMITLFIDTIFFSAFYTDNGVCAGQTLPAACIAPINTASNEPFCEWTEDPTVLNGGVCTMVDPPYTVLYSIIVAMVCITVSFPIVLLFDALFSVAVYRPDLSKLGFVHPELWLGRASNIKVNQNNSESSVALYDQSERTVSALHPYEIEKISNYSYMDEISPADETEDFIEKIQLVLKMKHKAGFFLFNSAYLTECERATLGAIVKYAGVDPDGTPRRLPLKQLLYYGTAKKRLEAKIRRSRLQQKVIRGILESKGELEVKNKDKALIQFFVKEQFNSFKQYILRYHYGLLSHDATAPLVHPIPWLICWTIIFLGLLFFLFWIFQWAVVVGNASVISRWALNFAIIVVQDLTLVNILRILTIHVIAMVSIRPQLKYIHQVLTNVAIGLAQNAAVSVSIDEFSVFQHLSPACRAARMKVSEDLFSAQILRRIRDVDVKTCRTNNDLSLALLVLLLLSVPLLISLTSEIAGESVFGTFIGIICDSFILLNQFLYSISILVLLAPYVLIIVLYATRFWWARGMLNKANKVLSKMYYTRNRYSQWRQSLRNRRHMSVFRMLRILLSYLKRLLHGMKRYFLKLSAFRKNTYVSRDEKAFMWKNMNSAITADSSEGRSTLLFVFGSTDTVPSRQSQSLQRYYETRSSYTTTVLNTHTLTAATPTVREDSLRRVSKPTNVVNEHLSIYTPSNHRRNILEYYSSLFSLPQLRTRFQRHRSNDAEDQRDVDYVIDLRKDRPRLDDSMREHSKRFQKKNKSSFEDVQLGHIESRNEVTDDNYSIFFEGGSSSTETIVADNERYGVISMLNSASYESSPGIWPVVEDVSYDVYNNSSRPIQESFDFEESPLTFDSKPSATPNKELSEKVPLEFPSYDDSNLFFSEKMQPGKNKLSFIDYVVDMRRSKTLLNDSTRERSKQFRSNFAMSKKLSSSPPLPPPPLSSSSSSSSSSPPRPLSSSKLFSKDFRFSPKKAQPEN